MSETEEPEPRKFSVVFMSPHWQCDGYGIATVTRSLINDLWITDPKGQGLELSCIIVEDDKDDKNFNINLVGAIKPRGMKETVVPDLTWLDTHARAH